MCTPKTSSRGSSGVVPGWTAEVEPVRQDTIFWHNMWVQCGRPRNGIVADIIIRFVQSNGVSRILLMSALLSPYCLTMTETFGLRLNVFGITEFSSNVVDNISNASDITEFFADKYEDLYSCVAFCATDMDSVKKDITLLWRGQPASGCVCSTGLQLRRESAYTLAAQCV